MLFPTKCQHLDCTLIVESIQMEFWEKMISENKIQEAKALRHLVHGGRWGDLRDTQVRRLSLGFFFQYLTYV